MWNCVPRFQVSGPKKKLKKKKILSPHGRRRAFEARRMSVSEFCFTHSLLGRPKEKVDCGGRACIRTGQRTC